MNFVNDYVFFRILLDEPKRKQSLVAAQINNGGKVLSLM
jgi:hypothetical protein